MLHTWRPFKTRFRCAYTYRLKLACNTNSLTHYAKGTPSPLKEAPTACRHPVSGTISLPLSGCFSPFPHGTGSLSVDYEYLALEDGPPIFRQDFTCPALLVVHLVPQYCFRIRGYHPLWPDFPFRFANNTAKEYKADPISLATTLGISVDFCSCSYLDVSVHCVRFCYLCIQ